MPFVDLSPLQLTTLLKQIGATRDAGVLRKCLAWVDLYRGKSVMEVAARLQVSQRSIERWREELLHRQSLAVTLELSKGGSSHPGGRPNRWDDEMEQVLLAALSHRPDQLGYSATIWSASLIQVHLRRWTGQELSPAWIRYQLHRLGFVWKRPRYVLAPDPERSSKIAKIRRKFAKISARDVVLFEDETDLLLFPPLRSAWAMKGARIPVLLTGWNEKRVIFGAVNIHSGHSLFLAREHNRAQDFIAFLKLIRSRYRGWQVHLVLDEHPCHKAYAPQAYARRLGITLTWLPKRSPELNPVDSLWGKAKMSLSANRQYEDIDEQADDFMAWLESRTPRQILRLSGISPTFWLHPPEKRHEFVSPA